MPTQKLIEMMFQLIYSFKMRLHGELEREGLNIALMHIKSLKVISTHSPCTAQKIAQFLKRDKAQIARLVQSLDTEGLITRSHNPSDKRSHLLQLTDYGQDALKRMSLVEKRLLKTMTQDMGEEDIETFLSLMEVLKSNLQKQ